MGDFTGFLYGVFGRFAVEALKWFNIRHALHEGLPEWARSWGYWLVTIVMVMLGGGVVLLYLHSSVSLNPLAAFNIGASAPLIFSKLAELPKPKARRAN